MLQSDPIPQAAGTTTSVAADITTVDGGCIITDGAGIQASSIRIQLFPHTEGAYSGNSNPGFRFTPIDRQIEPSTLLRIGRKADKRALDETDNVVVSPLPSTHQHPLII